MLYFLSKFPSLVNCLHCLGPYGKLNILVTGRTGREDCSPDGNARQREREAGREPEYPLKLTPSELQTRLDP